MTELAGSGHRVPAPQAPAGRRIVRVEKSTRAEFAAGDPDEDLVAHDQRRTRRVLERAVEARARVAVLPCCHDLAAGDAGDLTGWVDGPLALDIMRAVRLAQQGYRVWTQVIPPGITPKNRLLLGAPAPAGAAR
jgi:hypothetical protein